MLSVTGCQKSIAIVLKAETSKKPAEYAVLSVDHVDQIAIYIGDAVKPLTMIDLLTREANDPLMTRKYGSMLDSVIEGGSYYPTAFVAAGFISDKGLTAIANNLYRAAAAANDVKPNPSYDARSAMLAAIRNRSNLATDLLQIKGETDSDKPESESSESTPDKPGISTITVESVVVKETTDHVEQDLPLPSETETTDTDTNK